jgi:hypothetical protein
VRLAPRGRLAAAIGLTAARRADCVPVLVREFLGPVGRGGGTTGVRARAAAKSEGAQVNARQVDGLVARVLR